MIKHERFNRKVYASKSDFTGALAKWLVKLSPYVAPINLLICIMKFNEALDKYPGLIDFKNEDFVKVDLSRMTKDVYSLLENIPEIMALNNPKNPFDKQVYFASRGDQPRKPDDDFIDVLVLARNITCEFATEADSRDWLDSKRECKNGQCNS